MLTERLRIVPAEGTWVVRAGGAVIGESSRALALHEADYPTRIYFPPEDIGMAFLERSATVTRCPLKGEATHWTILATSGPISDAGWSYEAPLAGAERIAGHLAFYADRVAVEQL